MSCSSNICLGVCTALALGGCAAGCAVTAGIGFSLASWAAGSTGMSAAAGTSYVQGA